MVEVSSTKKGSCKLDLSFKGERDYLHGTDIIPALIKNFGPVAGISVQIYRKTSCVLWAKTVTADDVSALRKSRELCVLMTYDTASSVQNLVAVTEDYSQKVTKSLPYDEALVTQTSTIGGNRIDQDKYRFGTFTERVVALNKCLLNTLEGKSSWLFCGLEISPWPADDAPLSICVTNKMARGMFKSSVFSAGIELGSIMFASVEK